MAKHSEIVAQTMKTKPPVNQSTQIKDIVRYLTLLFPPAKPEAKASSPKTTSKAKSKSNASEESEILIQTYWKDEELALKKGSTEYFGHLATFDNGAKSLSDFAKSIVDYYVEAEQSEEGKYNSIFARMGNVSEPKFQSVTKEDIDSIGTLWVDLDYPPGDKPSIPPVSSFFLPPSMIVDSGNGYHFYWLLDCPTDNLDAVESLNKQLETIFNSDAVSDVTRVLRIPGTWNAKDPENPQLCQIQSYPTGKPHRYTLAEIESVLRSPLAIETKFNYDTKKETDRSSNDFNALCALRKDYNFTLETIIALLDFNPKFSLARKYSERGEKYLQTQWKAIEKTKHYKNVTFKDSQNSQNNSQNSQNSHNSKWESQNPDRAEVPEDSRLYESLQFLSNGNISELAQLNRENETYIALLDTQAKPTIGLYRTSPPPKKSGLTYVINEIIFPGIIIPRSSIYLGDQWLGYYCEYFTTPNESTMIYIPESYLLGIESNANYSKLFSKVIDHIIPTKSKRGIVGETISDWLYRLDNFKSRKTYPTVEKALAKGIYFDKKSKKKWHIDKTETYKVSLTDTGLQTSPVSPGTISYEVRNPQNIGDNLLTGAYEKQSYCKEDIKGFIQYLLPLWEINPEGMTLASFGWAFATPYKQELHYALGAKFPYLHLLGSQDSGKSVWAKVTKHLIGLTGDHVNSGAADSGSAYRLINIFAESLSTPVYLEELPAEKVANHLIENIKDSYNINHIVRRGTRQQTMNEYPLCRPICITSNIEIGDKAARSRGLLFNVTRDHHTTEASNLLDLLLGPTDEHNLMCQFGLQYTLWTMTQDCQELFAEARQIVQKYIEHMRDLISVHEMNHILSTRQQHNYAVVIFGLLSFRKFLTEYLQCEVPERLKYIDSPDVVGMITQYGTTETAYKEKVQEDELNDICSLNNFLRYVIDQILIDAIPEDQPNIKGVQNKSENNKYVRKPGIVNFPFPHHQGNQFKAVPEGQKYVHFAQIGAVTEYIGMLRKRGITVPQNISQQLNKQIKDELDKKKDSSLVRPTSPIGNKPNTCRMLRVFTEKYLD